MQSPTFCAFPPLAQELRDELGEKDAQGLSYQKVVALESELDALQDLAFSVRRTLRERLVASLQ